MNGSELIQALEKKFQVKGPNALAKKLGLSPQTINNWQKHKKLPPSAIVNAWEKSHKVAEAESKRTSIKQVQLIYALRKKFNAKNSTELAKKLGLTLQTIINWQKREDIHLSAIVNAWEKSHKTAISEALHNTIKPIVEFYAINRCKSKQNAKFELFETNKSETKYLTGLREILSKSHGVYIFYDSSGQALYAGKAQKQPLWKEMNLAFNRDRAVQKIKLTKHPARNQAFKMGSDQIRQPKETQLDLSKLAYYFSAYAVGDKMIGDLEALLVRGFANDLLNKKMEKFAHMNGK